MNSILSVQKVFFKAERKYRGEKKFKKLCYPKREIGFDRFRGIYTKQRRVSSMNRVSMARSITPKDMDLSRC